MPLVDEKDIVRRLMAEKGVSQAAMSRALGLRNKTSVSQYLHQDGLKAGVLVRILAVLGCKLIVRDGESGKEYVVSGGKATCGECGAELPEDAVYCPKCGHEVQ